MTLAGYCSHQIIHKRRNSQAASDNFAQPAALDFLVEALLFQLHAILQSISWVLPHQLIVLHPQQLSTLVRVIHSNPRKSARRTQMPPPT